MRVFNAHVPPFSILHVPLAIVLLLLALVGSVQAKSFPATGDVTLAESQRWGSAFEGYVVSGCTHGPGAGTSATVPACRAFALSTAAPPRLVGFEETTARPIPYSDGDGIYWLGGRSDPAQIPTGWTCLPPGTHYCTRKLATRPPAVSGLVLLQQTTVAAGAISATDAVLPQAQGVYVPERYGAVGDGVTNDTGAFQTLVAALPRTGGTIRLTQGATYHVNSPGGLVVEPPVHLIGAGTGSSRITCGTGIGNAPCLTLKGTASRLSDLTVVGEQSNFTNANVYNTEFRHAVRVEGDHTWLERVQILDAIVGVSFWNTTGGGVHQSRLSNTVIDRTHATPCNFSFGAGGYHVERWTVSDTWIHGFGENISTADTSTFVQVHGTYVEDSCDNGIYLATVDHSLVSNNQVVRMRQDGIKVRGGFNSVVGNMITSIDSTFPARSGIIMEGYDQVGPINARRLLMSDNNVACNCMMGLYMGNAAFLTTAGVRDGVIANNIVRFIGPGNDATFLYKAGIKIQSVSEQMVVQGNVIQDAPEIGIFTNGQDAGFMKNLVIMGNIIDTVGTAGAANKGMHLGDIDGCLVSNNIIQNVLENDQGIHLLTVKNCDIFNNNVGSTTTPKTTGTIITESSGQVGLANTYRNNRTTGVTIYPYNLASGSASRVESNEEVVAAAALTTDFTIYPGQAYRWIFAPSGGTRTINVGAVWAASSLQVCNRSTDASNLTFAPLAHTIGPGKCGWYQATNPATFWKIEPAP